MEGLKTPWANRLLIVCVIVVLCCTFAVLIKVAYMLRPSQQVKDHLHKALENYICEQMYDGENLPLMLQYQNNILNAITFEILSFDVPEETMVVEFLYVDVLSLADSISASDLSADEYYRFCINKINDNNYITKKERISVRFKTTTTGYMIIQSEDLTNVLSGGVLNYYRDILEGIQDE